MNAPGADLDPKGRLDLSHLLPAARATAMLGEVERIAAIRGDRWIGYPLALAALERLEELLIWPARQRMPNLLVVGPTNNGKSMIIEKFRRAHRPTTTDDAEVIAVLGVQMPSEPSVARFYATLLAAAGAPVRPRQRLVDLERLTLEVLRGAGVRMLIIDELHNVLAGRDGVQREFLNVLRFLGNELRIPLVAVGTEQAYLAIRSDAQLENRFAPIALPLWREGEQVASLLASFAASMPLRRPSPITSEAMCAYVLERTEGTIGEIARLLTQAAVIAVTTGHEAIDEVTLDAAHYAGPSARRRLFERQLR